MKIIPVHSNGDGEAHFYERSLHMYRPSDRICLWNVLGGGTTGSVAARDELNIQPLIKLSLESPPLARQALSRVSDSDPNAFNLAEKSRPNKLSNAIYAEIYRGSMKCDNWYKIMFSPPMRVYRVYNILSKKVQKSFKYEKLPFI